MTEVINVYKQNVPAARFIGKKYGDADRVGGGFGQQWHEWFQNGWFAVLEPLSGGLSGETFPEDDANAYIGLMRWKEGDPFEYWIGKFTPPNTAVPEGFASVDFPAKTLGTCWLQGKEGEIFGREDLCARKLSEAGYEIELDSAGAWWFFERYVEPRFTQADSLGNRILDICFYVKG